MSDEPVNCGRCAHLWCRSGAYGKCASHARQQETGQIRPTVTLGSTCEHARLSAKFDPDFLPNLREARRGDWPFPSLLAPVDPPAPTIDPHASENQSLKEIRQDLFQD